MSLGLADRIRYGRAHVRALGPVRGPAHQLRARMGDVPADRRPPVATRHGGAPLYLRPGTADLYSYEEVFCRREYAVPELVAPSLIVDAGAQIGCASVFFASQFPTATVLAVEPDAANFALLERNTAPYPNVRPVLGALWKESGTIALRDPGAGTNAFQVWSDAAVVDDATVPALTVGDLLALAGASRIDLLKIDIEGAEIEVLATSEAWIEQVDAMAIELHDNLRQGCSRAFYQATERFGDRYERKVDLTTLIFRTTPGTARTSSTAP